LKTVLYILFLAALLAQTRSALAQKENALIRSGNKYYKQNKMDQSQREYLKALEKAPDNPAANYNLGNAEFRKADYANAIKSYDASIDHSPDKVVQEKGQYNKGVSYIKDQKLDESIGAWKNALKLDPNDNDARENLQKALLELKKRQPPKQQKKDQQQQQQQQDKKQNDSKTQQQQSKEQQSKLSKQQVEQLLNALSQKEKEVEEKMNQNKVKSLKQPEKDW
jgi:Ca-activated chloride channel family protein